MSEPNPSLIPSDDEYTRLIREQSASIQLAADEMRKLAMKMDRIRFAVEMGLATVGIPHPVQVPAVLAASVTLVDTVQAMSSRSDGKTDMVYAIQLCLVTAHRFADAAYRGYSRMADPLADTSEPIGI